MARERWFISVAFAVIFGMLSSFFKGVPLVLQTLVGLSCLCIGSAVYFGVRSLKSRDRYDLASLNELVRDGVVDESEIPEVPEDADLYCMYCHHTYGSKFKVCPRCGR